MMFQIINLEKWISIWHVGSSFIMSQNSQAKEKKGLEVYGIHQSIKKLEAYICGPSMYSGA